MPGISSAMDETRSFLDLSFGQEKTGTDVSSVLTEIKQNSPHTSAASRCPVKRKWSLKLQIPPVLRLPSPEKIFDDEPVGFDGADCGVFCKKGRRKKIMEDAHKIVSQLPGDSKVFFGVYDGHGGRKAAEFVAENLHNNIFMMMDKCGRGKGKEEAIKDGFLLTDQDFLKQGLSSGTCCVTVLIENEAIIVSNLGDCRAVLSRRGTAEALTTDHTAGREDEQNRIEKQGGFVVIHGGTWRVLGTLAVSRSIGDADLKEWVTAEPDTKIIPLSSDMEFLILASDGLWDKVGNQEAIDTAKRFHFDERGKGTDGGDRCEDNQDEFGCENTSPPSKARKISLGSSHKRLRGFMPSQVNDRNRKPYPGRLMAACKELVNLATVRGNADDITVMIIDLKHFIEVSRSV